MHGHADHQQGLPRMSRHDWWGVTVEAPDPGALARFYAEVVGWEVVREDADGAAIAPPEGVAYIGFERSEGFVPPVWPAQEGAQRITMHLDFEVIDLPAAVAHALGLGAREAGHQPQENVRVMLDPAGHPFCLYTDAESPSDG
ncbi:VOC family protein [Streptomyces sp. NPDC047108]|uniref:VOC family protein n=1 Tax=Streptomyces sp. NPDC047108 TaxID=3155025 RepID=UPI0033F206C2